MSQETIIQKKQLLIDLLNDYNKCMFELYLEFKQIDPLGEYVDVVSDSQNERWRRTYELKPKSLEVVYNKRDPKAKPFKHIQKYDNFCRIIDAANEKLSRETNKKLKKTIMPELKKIKLDKVELNQILPEIMNLKVSDYPCESKGGTITFREIICNLIWNDLNIEKVVYKSQLVKNIISTGLFDDVVKIQADTLKEIWQMVDKIINESRDRRV